MLGVENRDERMLFSDSAHTNWDGGLRLTQDASGEVSLKIACHRERR